MTADAIDWPDGARCALGLSFDVDAETAVVADAPEYFADAAAMTHQAFGPRIGVPRLLKMLDEEGVRATFFIPGYTARRWPGLVASVLEHGHEVGHHTDLHRAPPRLSAEEELVDFERAMTTLTELGATVRGFRAALWQATEAALRAAADHGLLYDSSLIHDDQPYRLRFEGREILELPVHWALNDWELYAFLSAPEIGRHVELPDDLRNLWSEELTAQRRRGGATVTTAHPFLSGRAARADALRNFIRAARDAGDVWIAPLGEIADHVAALPSLRVRDPIAPEG